MDNIKCIKEYIDCRAAYNYKERKAIREALKRNIKTSTIAFKPFVDIVENS